MKTTSQNSLLFFFSFCSAAGFVSLTREDFDALQTPNVNKFLFGSRLCEQEVAVQAQVVE